MTTKDTPPKVVTLAQSDALNATPPMRLDPQALIAKAIEAGANVETLERLVNLAKDIRAVSAREAYFESMAIFKRECPRIKKDQTANAGTYSYNYASLDGILDVVDPLLGKVGLTISWRQKYENNAMHASCVVTHRMGHQEESGYIGIPLEAAGRMNPAQRVGSATTYAKRYSLLAVLGLAPEDDDDAGGKTGRGETGAEREIPRGPQDSASQRAEEHSQAERDPVLFTEPQHAPVTQLGEEHKALDVKIAKHTDARITLMMHKFDLGEGEWQKLDLASKAMLAKHLEAGKK